MDGTLINSISLDPFQFCPLSILFSLSTFSALSPLFSFLSLISSHFLLYPVVPFSPFLPLALFFLFSLLLFLFLLSFLSSSIAVPLSVEHLGLPNQVFKPRLTNPRCSNQIDASDWNAKGTMVDLKSHRLSSAKRLLRGSLSILFHFKTPMSENEASD